MDMTVPETGNNKFAGTIDGLSICRDVEGAAPADAPRFARCDDHNRIRDRIGVRGTDRPGAPVRARSAAPSVPVRTSTDARTALAIVRCINLCIQTALTRVHPFTDARPSLLRVNYAKLNHRNEQQKIPAVWLLITMVFASSRPKASAEIVSGASVLDRDYER